MTFIANVLVMNGGSTFLLRICRELTARGHRPVVLLLSRQVDVALLSELERHARVVELRDFVKWPFKSLPSRLHMFAPLRWWALAAALGDDGRHVHVLGVFGLLFADRLRGGLDAPVVSAGVYHQNEFLLTGGSVLEVMARRLFNALPPANVVFFNDVSMKRYEGFYGNRYAASPLVPIGVEVPEQARAPRDVVPGLIVSVGSLVTFKTYNAHMVRVVAALRHSHPDIRYDIYGSGEQKDSLLELARELGVLDRIQILESVPYDRLRETVSRASIFVGSGTALLEAAALGVPAMIGIEAATEPMTYGFLSDISGLAYNEERQDLQKVSMLDLTHAVLTDVGFARRTGLACREKSRDFSVDRTTEGFLALARSGERRASLLSRLDHARAMGSTVWLATLDAAGIDRRFANRRAAPPPEFAPELLRRSGETRLGWTPRGALDS